MIHISLSPNVEKEDIKAAISRLVSFSRKKAVYQNKLREEFSRYFLNRPVYLFNSGRSALLTFLKSLNFKKEDEIIIQAFTCNAVANPIIWAGAKPIYCDIDETFNLDVKKLEKKINPNTKAIIVQNTFGISAKIYKILEIAKEYNILVIEDCAHALGAEYQERKLGTFGDAAFFSFGRDKIISSVYGGALVINKKELDIGVSGLYENTSYPSSLWTFKQVLHVPLTSFILKFYNLGGKYILYILQKINVLSFAVSKKERIGKKPMYFPKRLPEKLAYLAYIQFKKLDRLNSHRKKIAKIYEKEFENKSGIYIIKNYDSGSVFLRYPVIYKYADKLLKKTKKEKIILGDWYKSLIAPGGNLEIFGYKQGSCSAAEAIAPYVINLPTNIKVSEKGAEKIIELFV